MADKGTGPPKNRRPGAFEREKRKSISEFEGGDPAFLRPIAV
jgi:hypothetical protein